MTLTGAAEDWSGVHSEISELSLTVVTLFETKVCNLLSSFLMYSRTDVPSVQKFDNFSGSYSSD